MLRAFRAAFACALITLAITGTARAAGGTYEQQAQARAALEASAFPWGIVPAQVVIRSAPKSPADEWAGLPPARFTSLPGALPKAPTAGDQLVTIRQFGGRAPAVTPAAAATRSLARRE